MWDPIPKKPIAKASVHAGALYGCELDPLAIKNVTSLGAATAVALNCEWGPNNRIAAMLLFGNG